MENTSNYGLKRWDGEDRILHTEFNDNWDKIATASALPFSAVSILSQLSLNSSTRMRSVPAQRDSVLTHAVTHEQKKRGGNNGEKRICGG